MDVNLTITRALEFKKQGKEREAVAFLKRVDQRGVRSFEVFVLLGELLWQASNPEEAAEYFRKALELNPESEPVSLGLFHCLWEIKRTEDAFAEMKRFTAICKSTEYTRLLKDLTQK
jgi:tetratricopeptide (TPR) repeat protein